MRRFAVLAVLSLLTALAVPASAHPDGSGDHPHDPVDGPAEHDHQHGGEAGHLPTSSRNVELVGKVALTDRAGGIADVAAFGRYAYLNAFRPECITAGGSGTGVHVVDISDPSAPVQVNFLPAEPNSYVGEGIHVFEFRGRHILVHNNETCDSSQPVVSGFAVWDVTNPLAAFKIGQYGDADPQVPNQTFHTTHSVQGFAWQGRAYAVAQDNQDLSDVDIFDLTPAIEGTGDAVLVAEVGLEDWSVAGPFANGDSVFHHDMQQKVIDGKNYLAVSYWDAGQVLLDISDPSEPQFVTRSEWSSPDPQMPDFAIPEGNSHQSYWSADGRYLLSTDEDFSPHRTLFEITDGTHSGPYGAGQFGWTVPIPEEGIDGTTVWGGSGCEEDTDGNGTSDRAELAPASETGASVAVFTRGTCFFSIKVETAELAGYDVAIVGQSHAGTRNGLLQDGFICGGRGHEYDPEIHAVCIGHRAMHLLFDSEPGYSGPDGADMPAVNTVGHPIEAGTVFDGWGYVHLHDGLTLEELDTYAIPEALDPAYASGFGDLTVHEVKTDPRVGTNLAYFSWYAGGLRVARFGEAGITEVGHYIGEGGQNFWGVYPVLPGNAGRGRSADKARPLILISDRDSGLWIFRYTGRE